MPRVRGLVHRVEVERGLELGLAAREEHDAGDGRGHAAAQELEGVVSDLFERERAREAKGRERAREAKERESERERARGKETESERNEKKKEKNRAPERNRGKKKSPFSPARASRASCSRLPE